MTNVLLAPKGLAKFRDRDRPAWPRRPRTGAATRLLLVLAGALVVRFAAIDRSLWLDEMISLLQTDDTLGHTVSGQVNGVHPPLFHLVLHGWIELFGTAPEALRVLSIAWSLVAVTAVWGWSREAFPRLSPVPAAALAAFAPFSVWYATEIRMYSQLFALAALSGWAAWRLLNRGATPRRAGVLVGALTALVYTHYFATLFVAALGAFSVLTALTVPALRRRCAALLAACIGAGMLLAPWVAYVVAHRTAQPLTTVFDDPDVFTALIAALQMIVGFRSFAELGFLAAAWPVLCLLAVLVVPKYGTVGWRGAGLLVVLLLPPAMLAVLSLVASHSAFDSRYLTVCAAPLYLLGGALWSTLVPRRAAPWLAAVAITAAVAATVWQNHDPSNPKLYQLREAVAVIDAHARAGDAVMLVPQIDELGAREPILSTYRLRRRVRFVDTTPGGAPGTVAPELAWRRLRATRPARIFVISGFDALQYSLRDGRTLSGRAVAARYDRFLDRRARSVARLDWANVTVRVYAPRWDRR